MYQLISETLERLYECGDYEYKDSNIHGTGVFATKHFDKGDTIDKATDIPKDKDFAQIKNSLGLGEVTPMGSKINHSWDPNCILARVVTLKGIYHNLIAYKDIEAGDELTVDYSKYAEFKNPAPDWE